MAKNLHPAGPTRRTVLITFFCWLCLLPVSKAFPQVVLNEICSDSGGALLSPAGTTPDYIELFNLGTIAADISGWSLTDDPAIPNKYLLPAGTSIPGRGFAVVWLDSVVYPGLVSTNFSLKSSGEEVALYHGITRMDYLKYGPQVAGTALCRVPDGSGTWALGPLTPEKPNQGMAASTFGTASALRLNEWLATNSMGSDWLEVYNAKTNGIVPLSGLVISDKTTAVTTPAIIPNTYIGAGGFIRFWCDNTTNKPNHLDLKLSSTYGETLTIYAANRSTIIDRVVFGPQTRDVSMGRLPDGGTNIVYFGTNYVTPGEANAYRPITNIIINEILAHTDPPLEDAIELYNPTADTVDLSGWWLSNDPDTPQKFRIPQGTVVPPGGYKVFYEQNQLNGLSTTPGFNRSGSGIAPDFTFNSAHGDTAVLNEGLPNGGLAGARVTRSFDASANGISFGRYVKSSGKSDFVAMASRTFGADSPASIYQFREGTGLANSYPLVGPLVISEIYFQPPPIISNGSTNDNTADEFVELTSISSQPLALYDITYPTNHWRLHGGVEYDFPQNTVVPAGGRILAVNFAATNIIQVAAFRSKYNVPDDVPLFGPYSGKLNNGGDEVRLEKPDPVQLPPHPDAGFVPYVLVERVNYGVGNGWPTNASGTGLSIQRGSLSAYGNDETNWVAALPTAGRANFSSTSSAPVPLGNVRLDSAGFEFSFASQIGKTYQVEFTSDLPSAAWQTLTNLTGTGSMLTVRDAITSAVDKFYRVTER